MTRIGIVAERDGETRVALTPPTVSRLLALGYDVVVEAGAGAASAFPDTAYTDAGADDVEVLRLCLSMLPARSPKRSGLVARLERLARTDS